MDGRRGAATLALGALAFGGAVTAGPADASRPEAPPAAPLAFEMVRSFGGAGSGLGKTGKIRVLDGARKVTTVKPRALRAHRATSLGRATMRE